MQADWGKQQKEAELSESVAFAHPIPPSHHLHSKPSIYSCKRVGVSNKDSKLSNSIHVKSNRKIIY